MTWKKSKTMESKITFKIAWDIDPEEKSGYCLRRIKCGDAEDIPVPLYMAILKAMLQVEDILNGKEVKPDLIPALDEETKQIGHQIEEALQRDLKPGDKPVRLRRVPTTEPPPKNSSSSDKRYKRFTVEEKTEIAMKYANGEPIASIAKEFDRTPASIQKLISSMGVHRGDDLLVPEQGDTTDSKCDRPTTESKGSVLKKPWYLKPQLIIKDKK